MALFNKNKQSKKEDKSSKKNKKQQKNVVISIGQVFRNLSISVNLTVYSIYFIYLIYSIVSDVGIKLINIALAIVTAAFMGVYLFLRLSSRKTGKELKRIKHYYKNFKLVARTVSALTAVYALVTAVGSVSPIAIILSFLGAVFLVMRLIVELVLGFIKRKIRKLKDNVQNKFKKNNDGDDDEAEAQNKANAHPKRRKMKRLFKTKKNQNDDYYEDVLIPVDQCLLNDVDE